MGNDVIYKANYYEAFLSWGKARRCMLSWDQAKNGREKTRFITDWFSSPSPRLSQQERAGKGRIAGPSGDNLKTFPLTALSNVNFAFPGTLGSLQAFFTRLSVKLLICSSFYLAHVSKGTSLGRLAFTYPLRQWTKLDSLMRLCWILVKRRKRVTRTDKDCDKINKQENRHE